MRHFEATFLMTGGGPANSTSVMGLMLYKMTGHLNYGHANAVGAVLILLGGVVTAGTFVFIYSWNEFIYALLLISSIKARTLQLGIRFFTRRSSKG
jgi:ABC-type Fe3+ transport system permease subunit